MVVIMLTLFIQLTESFWLPFVLGGLLGCLFYRIKSRKLIYFVFIVSTCRYLYLYKYECLNQNSHLLNVLIMICITYWLSCWGCKIGRLIRERLYSENSKTKE
jgi:hypothetical protein